jgi:hypothetical protein
MKSDTRIDGSFIEAELNPADAPDGVDRRGFMMRSALVGDFDTTVDAMTLTAKEMNSKFTETSEGGLAVSVVLC